MKITSNINVPKIYGDNDPDNLTTGTTWSFLYDASRASEGANENSIVFQSYFYTNCIRTKFPRDTYVKSLFSYFDVQIHWRSVNDYYPEGVVTKNIRLIKLFSELGIFNNDSKVIVDNTTTNINKSNIYYTFSDLNDVGVCIVEVDGRSLSNIFGQENPDTVVLFLGFSVLLETDYSNMTTNYPTTGINTNLFVIGLSSAFPMSNQNAYVKTTSTKLDTYFNGPSSYQWYLGSLIYITKITSNEITTLKSDNVTFNNLLIPIYCPYKYGTKRIGYSHPSIIAFSFISKNEFQYNYPVVNYISFKNNEIKITYKKTITNSNLKAASTLAFDGMNSVIDANLTKLYIHDGTKFSPGKNIICNAHVVMTGPNVESNEPKLTLAGTEYTFSAASVDYSYRFLGKKLNKFYTIVNDSTFEYSPTVLANNSVPATSTHFISGILRPSLSHIHEIRSFNRGENTYNDVWKVNHLRSENSFLDLIAYSCIYNAADRNYVLSNIISFEIDPTFSQFHFLTEFSVEVTSGDNVPSFGLAPQFDSNYTYYNRDYGSNIQFVFNSVGENFGSTVIRLTSKQFTKTTVCGLSENTETNYNCIFKEGSDTFQIIDCSLPNDRSAGTTLNICCFNIDMNITTREETFTLDLYEIIFHNKYTFFNTYFYVSPTGLDNSVKLDSSTSLDNIAPKITSLFYYHVSQNLSFGKLQFNLDLQRDLSRNFTISLNGNFNPFKIKNIEVNCLAYFSSDNNGLSIASTSYSSSSSLTNDNVAVEACYLGDLLSTDNKIKVSIKNQILKCGLKIKKTLKILLWPIREHEPKTYQFNDFTIDIYLNDEQNTTLLPDISTVFALPNMSTEFKPEGVIKEYLLDDSDNCLKQIIFFHSVQDLINNMTFMFSLEKLKGEFTINETENTFNEISFFFPLKNFEQFIYNLTCQDEKLNNLSCNYDKDGILIISFPDLYKKVKFSISIIGITVGSVESAGDIHIGYSFSNLNSETGTRYNVVNGIQKTSLEPIYKNQFFGNLLVVNTDDTENFRIPRERSSMTLNYTFDSTQDVLQFPFTIVTPIAMINFPTYYYLIGGSESLVPIRIVVSVVYKANSTREAYEETLPTKNITEIPRYGNLLIVIFSENLVITNEISYISFKLDNILNPPDQMKETEIQIIKCYIGSSTENKGLVSLINLNNKSGTKLDSPLNSNLFYNKGIEYKFLNTKLVIDFKMIQSDGTEDLNFLFYPGRFFPLKVELDGDKNKFPSARTTITLNNSYFTLQNTDYNVSAIYENQELIYMGASCGTLPGNYIVNFTSSNINQFFSLYPLRVKLDITSTGTIKIVLNKDGDTEIPDNFIKAKPGFASYLFYSLSESNVDELLIEWTPQEEENAEFAQASILKGLIKRSTIKGSRSIYGTPFYTNNGEFKFKAKRPNFCFTFNQETLTLSFKDLQEESEKSPGAPILTTSFTYWNNETDTSISDLASVRFNFTSPTFPIFLYCSLVCRDSPFPPDEKIYNQTLPTSNILQYYEDLVFANKTISIDFNGLTRGWQYKLRCLASTTDYLYTDRSNNSITYNTYFNFTSEDVPIKTIVNQDSVCVDIWFPEAPKPENSTYLLNLCQTYFVSNGFDENGCYICADTLGIYPEGFSFKKTLRCGSDFETDSSGQVSQLRNLQRKECEGEDRGVDKYGDMIIKTYNNIADLIKDMEKESLPLLEQTRPNEKQRKRNLQNTDTANTETMTEANGEANGAGTETNGETSDNSTDATMETAMMEDTNAMEMDNSTDSMDNASTETTEEAITEGNNTDATNKPLYFRYAICATQDRQCKTNFGIDPKNYSQLFEDFRKYLNKTANVNQNLTHPIPYKGVGDIFLDNEESTPNISNITIINLTNTIDNKLSWTATYKGYLSCYWIINEDLENPPSVFEIESCSNSKLPKGVVACSNQSINPQGVFTEIGLENKLIPGVYNIWMYCINDLPNSRIASNVASAKLINVMQGDNGGTVTSDLDYSDKSDIDIKSSGIPILSASYVPLYLMQILLVVLIYIID